MKNFPIQDIDLQQKNSPPTHFDEFFNITHIKDKETPYTDQNEISTKKEIPMSKVLEVKYHNQINNKILPYVTCGTTSLSMYLNYLNDKFSKSYECDDDKVFEILNGPEMTAIAKDMVKKGIIDKSALEFRVDNVNTEIKENLYNHTNNMSDVLAQLGNFITKNEYIFKTIYLDATEIKGMIDKGYPVEISGKFTAGGHFVLIVGYDGEDFICHDPYGNFNKAYAKDTLGLGSSLKYNIEKVSSIATIQNSAKKAKCLIVNV